MPRRRWPVKSCQHTAIGRRAGPESPAARRSTLFKSTEIRRTAAFDHSYFATLAGDQAIDIMVALVSCWGLIRHNAGVA